MPQGVSHPPNRYSIRPVLATRTSKHTENHADSPIPTTDRGKHSDFLTQAAPLTTRANKSGRITISAG